MIAQPLAIEVGLGRPDVPCLESTVVPPRRRRLFLNFAAVMFVGWTLAVLFVVLSGRLGTAPHVPDVPQRFMPGSPLPREVACATFSDELFPRCVVYLVDYD